MIYVHHTYVRLHDLPGSLSGKPQNTRILEKDFRRGQNIPPIEAYVHREYGPPILTIDGNTG